MKPISNVKSGRQSGKRTYSSALRDGQADETRIRILEALIRTMGRGVAELTVPAVAEEAGVSIPTVYRHFGSKRELLDALGPYLVEKTRLMPENPPQTLDDLRALARDIYRRHDEMDPAIRAAMTTELGGVVRREYMPERLATMRDVVRGSAPELDDRTVERLSLVLVLLYSSAVMRAMKDYFELVGDDAAERVAWAVEMLVVGARNAQREEGSR
jgi:AcrR family transcriptional regulator